MKKELRKSCMETHITNGTHASPIIMCGETRILGMCVWETHITVTPDHVIYIYKNYKLVTNLHQFSP